MMDVACMAIWAFLGILNLAAFFLVRADKRMAGSRSDRKAARRVPERNFVLFSLLGAWPALWLGFLVFHHKTRKSRFLALVGLASVASTLALWGWLSALACLPGLSNAA